MAERTPSAQLDMPFLGAVEGASLEAAVARMQRMVEGLNADQLRRLHARQKSEGTHYHVAQVISAALIAAIRTTPAPGEDVPNDSGVYDIGRECMPAGIDSRAIQIIVHTAHTRWGWMAAANYQWSDMSGGGHLPKVCDPVASTEALAAAAEIERLATRLHQWEHPSYPETRRMDAAAALGLIAQRASLLRSGLAHQVKVEPASDPKRARASKPRKAAASRQAAA